MENSSSMNTTDDLIDLPPGFRFHPTDEELITHYLSPKSLDSNFTTLAIGDVDLNKVEPWDLPWKAKIGEKEWYFFFVRDRKYPTGLRTNRATDAGYWKATGKDKDIFLSKTLIGMKKTLVFYRGRAPRGQKTNWVMHEYRLEGENHKPKHPKTSKKEWVICRVFKKSSGGKKVHISGMTRERECNGDVLLTSDLPPLKELSPETNDQRIIHKAEGSHATCFSKDEEPQAEFLSQVPTKLNPMSQNLEFLTGPDSYMAQDQSILMRLLLENNGQSISKQNQQQDIVASYGHELGLKSWEDQVNLDCLWNY